MKFGCCTNMIATQPDSLGIEFVGLLVELGYDYIELSLSDLMTLNDEEFRKLKHRLQDSGIICAANNNFFPAELRLIGNNVNMRQVINYVEKGFSRVSQLGSRVVVFGSAGAKNVPTGFSHKKARGQLIELLQTINPLARSYNIIIAIEPLNRSESNIINTVAEGLRLARDVNESNIKLLVDFYHMALEKEELSVILEARDFIKHVHFSELLGRTFPMAENNENYESFFNYLNMIDYNGNLSIEAYSDNFYDDAKKTISLLNKIARYSHDK